MPGGWRPGWSIAAGSAVLLLLWLAPSAGAATIGVNTTADEVSADAHCSLREAISAANADSTGPGGDCAKGTGTDTITVPSGHFTLSITGIPADENANDSGDLDVLSNLTITGAGAAASTIDANGIDRVLEIRPGRVATVRGVTITGGRAPDGGDGFNETGTTGNPGADAQGEDGDPGAPGGGIFNNAGSLTLVDSTVTGNVAGTGGTGGIGFGGNGVTDNNGADAGKGTGGAGGAGGDGGGIDTTGALVLIRVRVTGNTAGTGGAGGVGIGGQGGGAITGHGGHGGTGLGGAGGAGGRGGGVSESGGGSLRISQSAIVNNIGGTGGQGLNGQGGDGGFSGGTPGTGGTGGTAQGGIGGRGGFGGGVAAVDPAMVTDSLISGNSGGAAGHGGNGTGGAGGATFDTGSVSGDGGPGFSGQAGFSSDGGGLWMVGSVTNSTVTANVAGNGGDAGNATGGKGGNSQNGTGGDGGGGFADLTGRGAQGGFGGGVSVSTPYGDLTVRHATVTANSPGAGGNPGTATAGAGGTGGLASGSSGTVTNGVAGSPGRGGGLGSLFPDTTLRNSIVANNTGKNCDGPLVNGGHNIAFPGTNCVGAAHVAPKLGPLANNGGPTRTQALGAGSPAIDAVPASASGCPVHDQRGVARPHGPACDIGAYEHAPPTVVTGAVTGITGTAGTLHGQLNPNARPTTYHFVYGKTTSYGNSTTARKQKAGTSTVAVAAVVGGLAHATTYHYRLIATNADGKARGKDRTFKTAP